MTNDVKDYQRYTNLMRNGFMDKLFFIDKLFDEWQTLVDYGCADGFQTKLLAQIFPDKRILGYDKDPQMIERAEFFGSRPGNVGFTSSQMGIACHDIIYLSSVLHEVYSYSKDATEIQNFWKMVFSRDRKYVIIRDMTWDCSKVLNKGKVDLNMVGVIRKYCIDHGCGGELDRFEEHFGDINLSIKNMMHFLLKFPYINSPNWMREVHENYLPLSYKDIESLLPTGWEIDYSQVYTLPYLKHLWKQTFGLNIPYVSHAKIIIKRQ